MSNIQAQISIDTSQGQASLEALNKVMSRSAAMMDRIDKSLSKLAGSSAVAERSQQRLSSATERTTQAGKRNFSMMGIMAGRSDEANLALNRVGSSAQGVMLGMSLLQRNIIGVGFSLIFLKFGLVAVALKAAALTLIIGGTVGLAIAFFKLEGAAVAAGKAMEETGQRMASFFRSGKLAQVILTQADEIARAYGVPREEAVKTLDMLERLGLRQEIYIKSILNAAAATGRPIGEIAQQFTELIKASSDQRSSLVQKFARDMDITVKNYTSTIELAKAVNDRFFGAAEAAAQTQVGLINRLRAAWQALLISIGSVIQGVIKPLLDVMIGFVNAMVAGFNEAKKAAEASGELAETLSSIRLAARRLLPLIIALGHWIGNVLFKATLALARGMKIMLDAMRAVIRFGKVLKDLAPGLGQSFKLAFDPIVGISALLPGLRTAFAAFISGFTKGAKELVEIEPKPKKGGFFNFLDDLLVGFKLKDPKAIFKVIQIALTRVLKGLGRGIIRPDIFLRNLFGFILKLPSRVFVSLLKGLKTGLIFGLIEALSLTAVDLLPISEKLKTSISGILQTTFLGAGVGFAVAGPLGALVGGAIGLGIGGALELAFPGSVVKFNDWLERMVVKGAVGFAKFIKDDFAPAVGKMASWLADKLTPAFKAVVGAVKKFQAGNRKAVEWIKDTAIPILASWGQAVIDYFITPIWTAITATVDFLERGIKPLAKWLKDRFAVLMENVIKPVIVGVKDVIVTLAKVIKEKAMKEFEAMKKIWEDLAPVLSALWEATKIFGTFLSDVFVKAWDKVSEAAKKLWGWLDGPTKSLLQASKILGMWIEETFMPILKTLIEKGFDALAIAIEAIAKIPGPFEAIAFVIQAIKDTVADVVRDFKWLLDHAQDFKDFVTPGGGGGIAGTGFGPNIGPDLIPGFNAPPAKRFGIKPEVRTEFRPQAFGGITPGAPGTKQLVLADAGETFFNAHPTFASGRPSGGRGGGGTTIIVQNTIVLRDATVTTEAGIDRLTDQIAQKIVQGFGRNRQFSQHRVR